MKYQISNIKSSFFAEASADKQIASLIKVLLKNRGVKTKKEIEQFLNPKLEDVTIESVGIDKKQVNKAIIRIQKAIENKEQIIVFGDYDVDGICGTAILWETLYGLGANVLPYIPHRIDEGYGLSIGGIQNLESKIQNTKLIITVDNGIVANKAVDFANKNKIDVIITDHHVPPAGGFNKLPNALAIVHTTILCGAGVAYLLAQEISHSGLSRIDSGVAKAPQNDGGKVSYLELVALATVADLVPLTGANRTLLKFGLEQLKKTKRVGLLELFKEAGIEKEKIGVYEIGHIIAPRLNAMGRLESAMDSLRLLCTSNKERARKLAETLGITNRERQELTIGTVEHARIKVQSLPARNATQSVAGGKLKVKNLLFISDKSYQQGVIGLVAGRLVEEFYRPSIVVSIGEKYSKASARSVKGFNIIEFIRTASKMLVDAGGHPMAAGFTFETSKLTILQKTLEEKAEELLTEEHLTRTLKIDCELDLSLINNDLYKEIQKLSPFGMGNPEPTFIIRNVIVNEIRTVGKENKHLKLQVAYNRHSGKRGTSASRIAMGDKRFWTSQNDGSSVIDGIGFGLGEKSSEIHVGDRADIVYIIDENKWNGNFSLQLKIRDIKII